MKKILLFFLIFVNIFKLSAKAFLFDNGKSNFCIVVPKTASTSEKTAASELQSYLRQISGVTFDIYDKKPAKGRFIYIGYDNITNEIKPDATSEAYTYKTINDNLYIWGGSKRGTMYGVFSFLENELGVRWYTSDYTKITRRTSYILPILNHTEKPYVKLRQDFYYTSLHDEVWCAHNKINGQYTASVNKYGGTTTIYGMHTMFDLVPPATYFKLHPEYYSLRNGKRKAETGQLCLSNPDVLLIVKRNIFKTIRENPDYWIYDVSQMDNHNYCQCEECTAIANEYGGQSGVMVWFINQIADAVKEVYPDKMISTFAYLYTRHAPKGIKPRSNVVIRLCDIECCFHHALSSTICSKNSSFINDLRAWGELSQNIYIWDYVVNFKEYLVPYPDFGILKSNIITFANNGAIGILEEGAHDAKWAEFSELRQWMIAKLLWNPNQDITILAKSFCKDYYGNASDAVYRYYLMTQQIPEEVHITYHDYYAKKCYDDEFLTKAKDILEAAARSVTSTPSVKKRVDRVLAQVYYTYCCRHLDEAKQNGTYQKLKDILTQDPTYIREGSNDLDKNLKSQGYT